MSSPELLLWRPNTAEVPAPGLSSTSPSCWDEEDPGSSCCCSRDSARLEPAEGPVPATALGTSAPSRRKLPTALGYK